MSVQSRLIEIYSEVIVNRMGHDIHVWDDALVFHPSEGWTLCIPMHPRDPEFFVLYASFPKPDATVDHAELLAICSEAGKDLRLTRIDVTREDVVLFSTHMLVAAPDSLPDPDYLHDILPQTIGVLMAGAMHVMTEILSAEILAANDCGESESD